MRTTLMIVGVGAVNGLLAGCGGYETEAETTPIVGQSVSEAAFQSAVCAPPKSWSGPSPFELSHDYPKAAPAGGATEYPWLGVRVDFDAADPSWKTGGWAAYAQAVLDYVKQGQDPALGDENGWSATVDGATRWYHVPWMATKKQSGREFVHGLTNERTSYISSFLGDILSGHNPLPQGDGSTEKGYATWAFGVYNPPGGYSIGQCFPATGVPAVAGNRANGMPFGNGSLVVKRLFSTASAPEVPFLENSPEWTANIHVPGTKPDESGYTPRKPGKVRLVQMDIAVVDDRSPMGWVFGTFVYNSKKETSGTTAWDRLSILGLQWGSDPGLFPAVAGKSTKVQQSVLAPIDIYEHYGAGHGTGVGAATSTCWPGRQQRLVVSVLSPGGIRGVAGRNPGRYGSQHPARAAGIPSMGTEFNPENKIYFSNIRYPGPYPRVDGSNYDAIPLDTSLQLSVAFTAYAEFTKP